MTFTDIIFWPAFAVIMLLMLLFRNAPRGRNIYLILVSLGLYWYCGGVTVAVLLFVTLSDYFLARGIWKARRGAVRKLLLFFSVAIDVLLLCYFKYASFVTEIINDILHTNLVSAETFPFSALVPVGISFFIFKNIGYTVDVYRGKSAPVYNFWDFMMFTTFFPVAMSGPILRADQFVPQLHRKYELSRRELGLAVFWILNGLAKKIILGDYLGMNFVDRVFDNPHLFTGFESLCAAFGFSLQLYADFSGYTDIATGVSLLLGFRLPKNFDSPYKSTDAQGFWKRWHISLSSWLQDYLYYPLGGNRRFSVVTFLILYGMIAVAWLILGYEWIPIATAALTVLGALYYLIFRQRRKKVKGALNTMVTMLLGGLWHGAAFNFITWGGVNGLGIIASRSWKDAGWLARLLIATGVLAGSCALKFLIGGPLTNIALFVTAIFCIVTVFRAAYAISGNDEEFATLGKLWAVAQTFVFATFAWIFFRASSFDDAIALLSDIGDPARWELRVIPEIVASYWKVLAIMAAGLLIHWIPEKYKSAFRFKFADMPLPLMSLVVIISVFVIIQFASATPHPFIYFQF